MSAPNFVKHNARDYFCVGINREDDEWVDWDMIMEDIQEVAKSENEAWSDTDEWEHSYGRDYQLHYNTERSYSMQYGGEWYYAKVMLGLRSAYYVGATIDYDIQLSDGSYWSEIDLEYGDTDRLASDFILNKIENNDYPINKGLFSMQRKGLEKRLTAWLDSIVEDCEKICRTCAEEELVCVARFSNGEAMYERKTPRTELKAKLQEVV